MAPVTAILCAFVPTGITNPSVAEICKEVFGEALLIPIRSVETSTNKVSVLILKSPLESITILSDPDVKNFI